MKSFIIHQAENEMASQPLGPKKWRSPLLAIALLLILLFVQIHYYDLFGVKLPYLSKLAPLAHTLAYLFSPFQPLVIPYGIYHSLKSSAYPMLRKQGSFRMGQFMWFMCVATKIAYAGFQLWRHSQGQDLHESIYLGEPWQAWEEIVALIIVVLAWNFDCKFDGGAMDVFLEWSVRELEAKEEERRKASGEDEVIAEKV